MCPSYMVTLDEKDTTRARANTLRLVMSGALPADGLASEALDEVARPLPPVQGVQDRVPVERRHGQAQGRVPPPEVQDPAGPARLAADGPHPPAQPARLGDGPAGQLRRSGNPAFKWLLEKVAGIDRRRTLPTFASDNLRRWFRRHQPDPRAGTRGVGRPAGRLLHDLQQPRGRPGGGPGPGGGRLPGRAGGPGLLRPAGDLQGAAALGRTLARENVARLVDHARRGTPILGCEPSCLLTLVDEYRDFRLGPDADLVASAAKLVDAFVADRRARARPAARGPARARSCSTAIASRRRWSGTAGTVAALRRIEGLEVKELDSGCCGMAGSFGYELGHYEVSTALAEPRPPARRRGPSPTARAGRPRLLVPEPGPRPGGDRRPAPDRGHRRAATSRRRFDTRLRDVPGLPEAHRGQAVAEAAEVPGADGVLALRGGRRGDCRRG